MCLYVVCTSAANASGLYILYKMTSDIKCVCVCTILSVFLSIENQFATPPDALADNEKVQCTATMLGVCSTVEVTQ